MDTFLYRLQPTRLEMLRDGPTDREAAIVAEHFAYLQGLCQSGTVLLAGRSTTEDERVFGIVLFRAPNAKDAERIMAADPAVAQGVMHGAVFPFSIALWGEAPQLS